jgi:hypothetical protein
MLIAFYIVLGHFIADFIFQSEEWAINKSKSIIPLIEHTGTYSFLWFVFVFELFARFEGIRFPFAIIGAFAFAVTTFIAHTATDYFTSKVTSKLFAQNKLGSSIPNLGAFSMIGFDQVLHYAQLFLTYHLILKDLPR